MGTVFKKFDCDFDPYIHARELIAEEEAKVKKNKTDENHHEHDYSVKQLEWSIHQHSENTHDTPFAYLDHAAHEDHM